MPLVPSALAARTILAGLVSGALTASLVSCIPNKSPTTSDQGLPETSSGTGASTVETSAGTTEDVATTGETDTSGPATSTDTSGDPTETWDPDGEPVRCQTWESTCPRGYKCNPYEFQNSAACFPVDPDPDGLKEPCQNLDPQDLNVLDSCDKGLTCWHPRGSPECIPFCEGFPGSFTCPAHYACVYLDPEVAVCHPICDPLASDCPDPLFCGPSFSFPTSFICLHPNLPQAGLFEPCQSEFDCPEGLLCQPQQVAVECDSEFCCNSLCALDGLDACPGAGQECVALIESPMYPEYENLGYCKIP